MPSEKKWELKDQTNKKLTITIAEKTTTAEQSADDASLATDGTITSSSSSVSIEIGNQILTITIAE